MEGLDPYHFVMAATGRVAPGSLGLPAEVNIYRWATGGRAAPRMTVRGVVG